MFAAAKRYTRIAGIAALSIVFLIFAVDNREVVHASLFPLPFVAEMPLFLFTIFVFFFGSVVGFICTSARARRFNAALKAEQKRAAALENQLHALQTERLPPAPPALLVM